MKIKCLILLSILYSLVFIFPSCSDYDNMGTGDGNTSGGGLPKIDSEKNVETDTVISLQTNNDSIVSPIAKPFGTAPEDGNTGGGGMPKKN